MERRIFSQVADFIVKSKTHSILLVKGARQVGKTYVVEAVLNRLDLPSIRMNLEKDIVTASEDTGYLISAAPYQSFDIKKLNLTNIPVYMAERI